jgi:hypothetical protein
VKTKLYCSDVITIAFFHISFINMSYLQAYNLMKYAILAAVALYMLPRIKMAFTRAYRRIDIVLFCLLLTILLTSFFGNTGRFIERNVFLAAIVHSAVVLEAFLLFQYFDYKHILRRVIRNIYYLTLFYVIVTDISILALPVIFERYGVYLVGTKFWVSYLHIQLIALYWARSIRDDDILTNRNKIVIAILFALTCFIVRTVDCATGIVACVIILLLLLFGKTVWKLLLKPVAPIITLLVSCTALLSGDYILNIPLVQKIIETGLNRSLTITGRTRVYENIVSLFPDNRIWTGYGHGSSYEVSMMLIHSPNSQNGLVNILLQYGVFGAVLLFLLMYSVFKAGANSKNIAVALPFISLLYVYILLASVEITLELNSLVLLSLISVILTNKNPIANRKAGGCFENEKSRCYHINRVRKLR